MTTRPTGRQRGRPPFPLLTPAEERVLKFIREGKTNAEIGVRLGVSPDAVKYHVSNMLGKLGLSTREELAGWKPGSGNPLGRLWSAIPLFGKVGIGATAAVLAGGMAWSAVTTSTAPQLYDGLVTMGYDGEPANGSSEMLQISASGRYIVYSSWASNLVPDDTNNAPDVFRFDRETRKTELVSKGAEGGVGDGPASWPSVTADGRYVAYASFSPESAPQRTYGALVRDMETGQIRFKADDLSGPPAISGNGRYLATVRNDEPGVTYPKGTLLIYDLSDGRVVWSLPIDRAADPLFLGQEFHFSADGRWFAFLAGTVPGADCEMQTTVFKIDGVEEQAPMQRPFVHDTQTGETWCPPLGDRPDVVDQSGPLSVTGNTLAYGLTRWEPGSTRLVDSEVVLYSMESRKTRYVTRAGEPFFGTVPAPAVGDGGQVLAVVDNPGKRERGRVYGILWNAGGSSDRKIVEQPARFQDWNLSHSEPSLSEDGLSLAFTVQGQDRDSGSQVQDVYVVSR